MTCLQHITHYTSVCLQENYQSNWPVWVWWFWVHQSVAHVAGGLRVEALKQCLLWNHSYMTTAFHCAVEVSCRCHSMSKMECKSWVVVTLQLRWNVLMVPVPTSCVSCTCQWGIYHKAGDHVAIAAHGPISVSSGNQTCTSRNSLCHFHIFRCSHSAVYENSTRSSMC